MYIIKIEAVKAPHEIEFLTVFSPIEVGTEIGYSGDIEETDEIKKWTVCSCERERP